MNAERDKFLTEAMGECWHEPGGRVNPHSHKCVNCGHIIKHSSYADFSTWSGFGKLWEWAQRQEWWDDFMFLNLYGTGHETIAGSRLIAFPVSRIHPYRFANDLYIYLKDNK